jgi:phosphoribosylaminoimidazole carboxylase PurE protein
MPTPKVAIVVGSENDWPVLEPAVAMLERFGVAYERVTSSAHRKPQATAEWARDLEERGLEVVIAGAGYANHLAGTVAAHTILPVIGLPIPSSPLQGVDSLLSTVMMPSGVPVATVTIGKAGAKNAAILSVQILARAHPELRSQLRDYKRELADG